MRKLSRLSMAVLMLALAACGKTEPVETHEAAKLSHEDLYVVDHYDEANDPQADLILAIEKAEVENKHILLVIGGTWCIWCDYLADFLDTNEAVHNAFADSFVMMKVNYSPENKNEAFLGQYPDSEGYPDFFILDSDGTFIEQQGTAVLEKDRSYDPDKMLAFAEKWKKG